MDKTKAHTAGTPGKEESTLPHTKITLELPGGLEFYHDLQPIAPSEECDNLLDLKARQNAVPLFSTKARSMMGIFNDGRSGSDS
ncbi:hypothetical protein LPW11_22210 [Geomonas sp. RF6]|uniref:hypothetical protein n=1 Tax=Geomonas sp. RF6 TaxID=2897342 RepID=UPI001E37F925|nr:hypothetical protein [Geomonas sp. RF6]UFS70566.1 hypothetical protein LPW11_22210 [Geomonas sp. RF6]